MMWMWGDRNGEKRWRYQEMDWICRLAWQEYSDDVEESENPVPEKMERERREGEETRHTSRLSLDLALTSLSLFVSSSRTT